MIRSDPSSWRELREEAERELVAAVGVELPAVEARWIIERAAGLEGAALAAADATPPTALAVTQVRSMATRRATGEPLQYVLGEWSFRGLDLFVDARVLIPRPETEITAGVAIQAARGPEAIEAHTSSPFRVPSFTVADLGTGSGAIALALAVELPEAEVWASDISAGALAVARANLSGIGVAATRVRLVEGDWFEALPADLRGRLRVVVANPPYVTEEEFDSLPVVVAEHEPRLALVSGPTGLEAIERIVADATTWLEPQGTLVVEIAPHQAKDAREIARVAGFNDLAIIHDLAGRERVLSARVQ